MPDPTPSPLFTNRLVDMVVAVLVIAQVLVMMADAFAVLWLE